MQWFPADTVTIIAGFLDPKQYVRLLLVSKLTHTKLSPGRAAAVFPLALEHIKHLIFTERSKTVDPVFVLEKKVENLFQKLSRSLLHYSYRLPQGGVFSAYYFLSVDVSTVTINVNRWHDLLESENPGSFTTIKIEPSRDQPFDSGIVSIHEENSNLHDDSETDNDDELISETWEYQGGLNFFLRHMAIEMCPLHRGFDLQPGV